MKVEYRGVKGELLHFGPNEGRSTYTLNIGLDDGTTDSYPMLTEDEIIDVNIERLDKPQG